MEVMMKSYAMVFICIGITWNNRCQGETGASEVIISTRYGLLKGLTRYFPKPIGNISTVNKFLGIPYAAPPIGELRFRYPQKQKPWKGIYDATRFQSVCYQDSSYNEMFWPNGDWPQSEDCLYLNVYAPNTSLTDVRYPVMVYIHGGGYEAGSPVVSPGDALPMWEVVLVTIQYRLGPFGFISTGDSAAPGNYGMLDQIEALKWIQLNIEVFKGDPSRVTIFGESAGGSSVGLLLLSPLSEGLFHKAIALSGSDFSPFAVNRREEAVGLTREKATDRAKCPTRNNAEMIACMRRVDANSIWSKEDANIWRPIVDGNFLLDTPKNVRKAKKFHPYPLMIGVTSDDGSYFFREDQYKTDSHESFSKRSIYLFNIIRSFRVNLDNDLTKHVGDAIVFQYTPWSNINAKHVLRQGLVDLVTDFGFAAPAHAVLDLHTKLAPGYLFVFSHRSNFSLLPSWKGVAHKDDTPYEFGFPFMNLTVLQEYDERDRNVSEIIITFFTNFARTGNPTPQPVRGCTWLKFNETNGPVYMNITANPKMESNFHIKNIAFWNHYYPKLLNTSFCESSATRPVHAHAQGVIFTNILSFQVFVALVMIFSLSLIHF